MKKLLFILLLVALTKLCYATPFLHPDDPEIEKIEIAERPTTEPKNDRSISMVECTFNRSLKLIDVEYDGIGLPVVFILDQNDNIVCYQVANNTANHVSLILSLNEGCYRIVIHSSKYFGEGSFNI